MWWSQKARNPEKRKHMKNRKKKIWVWTVLGVAVLVLLIGLTLGIRWHLKPKFQNATVELGTAQITKELFLGENAVADWAQLRTQPDLSKVGTVDVTLSHLGREETVKLTVRDTVAPTAVFRNLTVTVDDTVTADMLVESWQDLSEVTFAFSEPLGEVQNYQDKTVTVLVIDASGNRVSGTCTIRYSWLREQLEIELGTVLAPEDLLLNPQKNAELIDPDQLAQINKAAPGVYTLEFKDGERTCTCQVTIRDTQAPQLKVRDVTVEQYTSVSAKTFLVELTDAAQDITYTTASDLSTGTPGSRKILLEAVDPSGNKTTAEATLTVVGDLTAPVFAGVGAMTVEKNSQPDYTAGVTVTDNRDGSVQFTYDASKVNTGKAGVYYVTYRAVDKAGNAATYRRKIEVKHDQADTDALVAQHAAKCGAELNSIVNYVRVAIGYNSNWGGEDPVWYGFTNKTGNCYVHALCLQRLLTAKGYTNQLIWCEDKTHYWVIVNVNGVWRHVDATPSSQHGRYPQMTDAQRLETLSGRKWDTTLWPECK